MTAGGDASMPLPPLDAELVEPLAQIMSGRRPSLLAEGIADDRRKGETSVLDDDAISLSGTFEVEVAWAQSADGALVELAVLTPRGAAAPIPVVLSIHGGGMVAGQHRSPELLPELHRAAELGMAVVSVSYRLAPEHPHPTPVEDCYAALRWIHDHASDRGFDPSAVLVSGVSAGGGLAAGVSILARDRGGPAVCGQVLLGPMLDDRVDPPSARQMPGIGLWDSLSHRTGWTALLGSARGGPDVPPSAAPARADDVTGLAPAYLDVGVYESLRDDSITYAARLAQAGVDVELHVWAGAFHSFDEWVPAAAVSRAAQATRVSWVRRRLAQRRTTV